MAERYALVIDDDTTFRDRVSGLLAPHKIVVTSASDKDEVLSLLEDRRPVLVILAVELPDKDGFALFRKVKKADFDVPVIITTATVAKAELSRHETQPSHAEYYLQKDEISDSDLLNAIAKAGRLDLTSPDTTARAEPSASEEDVAESAESIGDDLDPRLARYLDDETTTIFAQIDERALEEHSQRNPATQQGEVSAERVAELESEVDRLTDELDQSRSAARSSPFSKDFLKLRDVASQKDKEIHVLTDSLADRESQVRVVRRKLSELVKRFVGQESWDGEDQDELRALTEELDHSRAKFRDLTEHVEATELRHKQEIDEIAKRLVKTQRARDQERDEAAELRRGLEGAESTLGEVRQQSDQENDDQQRERKDLTKRLVLTQRERNQGREEATELKGLLESLEVKHAELTEQTDATKARHERESAELTERLEAGQKARDEARQETAEVRGLLDGVRAKLEKLTGEAEATRAKHEQEAEELTNRLVVTQRDRDERREEVTELRSLVTVFQAKIEQQTEKAEESRSKHEQDAAVLEERVVTGKRERDKIREEAADLAERLSEAKAKLTKTVAEANKAQGRYEQQNEALEQKVSAETASAAQAHVELETGLSELRLQHAHELQEHNANQKAEIKKREKTLAEEKAAAMNELKKKLDTRLRQSETSHTRSLAALGEEHVKELASVHSGHGEARRRAATEVQEALEEASKKNAAALKQSDEQRAAQLLQAENKRVAEVTSLEQRYEERLASLTQSHAAETSALDQKAKAAIRSNEQMLEEVTAKVQDVLKSWETERTAHYQTRERYEKETTELQKSHTKNLATAEQDQFAALAGMSRKFKEDRTAALEVERRRWQEIAADLQTKHAEALGSLKTQHEDELEQRDKVHDKTIEQKRREAMQVQKAALERKAASHHKALEKMGREHADEIVSWRQKSEQSVAGLRQSHMKVLADRDRDAEHTLRTTVEQLKKDHGRHQEKLRDAQAQMVNALRGEYGKELQTMEQAQRSALALQEQAAHTALSAVEEERDESRVMIDGLRAEIAEMAAKHRSSTRVAEEAHNAEAKELKKELESSRARLEVERQALQASMAKLERESSGELKQANESLQHEKKLHVATRERYERRVNELKTRHSLGIDRVESDWIDKLEHLETSLRAKAEKAVVTAEQDWKGKLESLRREYEEVVESSRKEFELELAAAIRASEGARSIEESYEAASRELSTLNAKLEKLETELSVARHEIVERDTTIQSNSRKAAEHQQTVDSLKAVINDFSRSVDGYVEDGDEKTHEKINSLKAVIDDMYRSIDGPKN